MLWAKRCMWGLTIFAAAAAGHSAVVINEILYDDSGVDSIEFVELYNTGPGSADVSGWRLAGIDTAPTTDSEHVLPGAPGSNTTVIPAGGFYVLGMLGVPNLNLDVTAAADWQNDMDAMGLFNGNGTMIDSVVTERNKANVIIRAGFGEPAFDGTNTTSGGGIWSNLLSVEQNGFDGNSFADGASFNTTLSWGRFPDGTDSNNNELDFMLVRATPGASNGSAGTVNPASFPYVQNFDAADGTTIAEMMGGRCNVVVQNPLTTDALTNGSGNPSVITTSPQSGNVGILWNAAGGRCSAILNLTTPVLNVRCEAYCYFPNMLGVGQSEHGTIFVVRGHPDGEGFTDLTTNGDTGIRLRWKNDSAGIRIYCEERINGVTTQIGAEAPVFVSDWYRVMLEVDGTQVRAAYGGTYGSNSGLVTMTGTTSILRPGGIGFVYEDIVTPDTLARPLTFDALTIGNPTSAVADDWMLYTR